MLQADDIKILKEELRQAQLHTAQLEAQQAAQSIEAGPSQPDKQAPPQVAAAEAGALEQGRAGLIMAYHPPSALVRNHMGLHLCCCKCLRFCRGLTSASDRL